MENQVPAPFPKTRESRTRVSARVQERLRVTLEWRCRKKARTAGMEGQRNWRHREEREEA